MIDVLTERHGQLLRQGSVLLDALDEGCVPSLLLLLLHEIEGEGGLSISRRLHFVRLFEDGRMVEAGAAPHLDLEALREGDEALVKPLLEADWVSRDLEAKAIAVATERLVPDHLHEVSVRRRDHIKKTRAAVHTRLTKEIHFQEDRHEKLSDDQRAGKDVRLNLDKAKRLIRDLQGRLDSRTAELDRMEHVASRTPTVLGAAFVVPRGLLRALRGDELSTKAAEFASNVAAKQAVERRAMKAVRDAEEARGFVVEDVSAKNQGWDLTSTRLHAEGREERYFLEVKGRVRGATVVTVTKNEVITALNKREQFRLAICLIEDGDAVDGPYYVARPFTQEPEFHTPSINVDLAKLLQVATRTP